MLDVRGAAKSLVEGTRRSVGYRLRQNGDWDDELLCKHHEDQIGRADDYAVRWIRAGKMGGKLVENGRAQAFDNPDPSALMHFVYAVIWRRVVSSAGRKLNLELGRYEAIIRNALLSGGPYDLEALACISGLGLDKRGAVPIVLDPYRQKFGSRNCWHFILCGFEFFLMTDQSRFPVTWGPYLMNGNDPIILSSSDFKDIREVPLLRPLLRSMMGEAQPD